ncbi:MAG: hypothetical protein FWD73_13855 [Polyangiaceae bacterium]|nr:hypothetical protein [Polyangiaceae bacterium]
MGALMLFLGLIFLPHSAFAVISESGTKPIVVAYFNGMWTTEERAEIGKNAVIDLMGTNQNGTPLDYELFYNQNDSTLIDLAETFEQRSKELDGVLADRWEIFWEILDGRHTESHSLTAKLLNGLGADGRALAPLIDATFNATLAKFVAICSEPVGTPSTEADYAAHFAKLSELSSQSKGFVLVGSSQGTLFVNHNYDTFLAAYPEFTLNTKTAFIAPASPTTRPEGGDDSNYILSSNDLVIGALRLMGGAKPNNITIAPSSKDIGGHALIETYLDPDRNGRARVQEIISTALDAVNAAPQP